MLLVAIDGAFAPAGATGGRKKKPRPGALGAPPDFPTRALTAVHSRLAWR